ncbi:MAG: hypothetical protein LBD24_04410 [Spirochaetaceae bacterium]|nr:hypothetical protein [Spirochaetaceae bacterium]
MLCVVRGWSLFVAARGLSRSKADGECVRARGGKPFKTAGGCGGCGDGAEEVYDD